MDTLTFISIISLSLALISAIGILMHVDRHPQSMKVMDAVWPLTALWGGAIAFWAYFSFGKAKQMTMKMDMHMDMPMDMKMDDKPFWQKVTLSTFHCGAGCTLADIIGEGIGSRFLPFLGLQGIGWNWMLDYVLALVIGAFFQYQAIRPMLKDKPAGEVFAKAIKVDFLSLTAWQVGMYAFSYVLFFVVLSQPLSHNTWSFWFVMQLAMCAGFILSYLMNWFLIKKGIKPAM